jgi:hypothetical protein
MTERISRIDANTLGYVVTFEDPTMWTQKWTVDFPMPRVEGEIYEYACHEGNYGLRTVLAGARAEEAAAAKAQTISDPAR